MIKIAVSGACGRMGSRIIALAEADKDISLELALECQGHPKLKTQIGGITITDDDSLISRVDCVIEFSQPQASLKHLEKCRQLKRPIVIGTTGFKEKDIEVMKEVAKTIPVLFSPNMSIGVNLVFKVLKEMSAILKDYEIKIIEAHHVHKKDAPSGTAKKIVQIIEEAGANKVTDIESIRKDEIIGDHEIIFDGKLDSLKLKHSAKTRDIFAQGSLLACKWLVSQESGLYNMQDCLFKL